MPASCPGTRNHRIGPDTLGRPLRAPLRPLQLSPRVVGRRDNGAAAHVHAAGSCPDPGFGSGHRPVRRAGAHRRLSGRRAPEPGRAVVPAARGHVRQRGARCRRKRIAGAHDWWARHPALGHDRDAGRPLYAARRPDRDGRRVGGPAEPRYRGEGGRIRRRGAVGGGGGELEVRVRCCSPAISTIRMPTATPSPTAAGSVPAISPSSAAHGNVAITGRCKDVINRGGLKYNPRDIEDLLAAHPQVDMAAIVPIPDPVLGRARLLLHHRRRKDSADARSDLRVPGRETASPGCGGPNALKVVEAMPLTATRKIIKGRLAERVSGALTATT